MSSDEKRSVEKRIEEKRIEDASGGRGPEAPGPPDWRKVLRGCGRGLAL